MRTKTSMLIVCGLLVASTGQAPATDVGAASNASNMQVGISADGIINFDQNGTLTMNRDATGVETISVAAGVTGTINFGSGSTGYRIKFKDAPAKILLGIGAQLTILGTDANAGFDFATVATGKTLTITSSSLDSLGDAAAANRLLLGNGNTVVFGGSGGATNALHNVVIVNDTTAPPTVDVNASMNIETLTVASAGDDFTLDIASTATATIADGLTLEDDTILEVGGAGGTLHFTGGLTLAGTSTLRVAGTGATVSGGVVLGPGTSVDVDASGSIAGVLELTGDAVLDVAAGNTLTTTVDVGEHALTLASPGTISTVLLATSGGEVELDAAATISSLQVTATSGTVTLRNGADLGGTVTVSGAGGRL
ncbi:MAG: hypothetical protein GY842_06465, partial [bacterium]|nr:hypothetical protein [bacterium]